MEVKEARVIMVCKPVEVILRKSVISCFSSKKDQRGRGLLIP